VTTSYFQRLRLIRREAWLAMSAMATYGLVQRGVFAVVFNLYLLRLGYGPEFIGLVNGLWLLAYAAPALPAGLLARRWGNRPMVILGKTLEAVGFVLVALADLLPVPWQRGWLLATFTLSGLGGAAWGPAYNVLLYSACGSEERDHAFSVSTVSNGAGGVVGSLVGGVLPGLFAAALALSLNDAAPFRFALLVGGLIDFASVLALLHTPKDEKAASVRGKQGSTPLPFVIVAVMSLCWLLFAGAYGPIMTFANVYLSAELKVPVAAVGLILASARLFAVVAGLFSPMVAARWGRFSATAVALSALAIALTLLLFLPHWIMAWLAIAIALVSALFVLAIGMVYAQELVAHEWRATISGSLSMAIGLGLGIVSLVGGYIISGWGYAALFAISAALALASGALFWAYFRIPRGELRAATVAAG